MVVANVIHSMQLAALPSRSADVWRVGRAIREHPEIAGEVAGRARKFTHPIALAAFQYDYLSWPSPRQPAGTDRAAKASSDDYRFALVTHGC